MAHTKSIFPLLLGATLMAGCLSDSSSQAPSSTQPSDDSARNVAGDQQQNPRKATLRRTSFGIPHIEAKDFNGMGYAYGYVQAEDNLCLLARDTLTIRGLRSRYLGPTGDYTIPSNGTSTTNLNADFFWRATLTAQAIAPFRNNSDQEVLDASSGYVEGFNRYVQEIRDGKHPGRHEECRNAEWLLTLEDDDMYRRYLRLAVLASSSVFIDGIASAQPPATADLSQPDIEGLINALSDVSGDALPFPVGGELPIGSNMYGLSAGASRTGESILFGNPHFPWKETERLYLAHLKVGDDTEIMGATLYGLPAVLIGFNDHLAWSHTVSTAYRFTFYELTLNPADPTQYLYEGEFLDMESSDITIEVLESDGSIGQRSRTLYRSKFGPMLTFEAAGLPILNWTSLKAYTLRDANAENDRLMNQFFRWNQANSLDEFIELHGSVLGVPWVNTVATGPGQPAYYGDVTVVPNVPDAKVASCATVLSPVFGLLAPGLPLLDGSRAECEWDTDADAPAPGIFGVGNLPTLTRSDWVHNCNDSYWATNPAQPLTGFAAIIGDEETPRTLRTRKCMQQVEERISGADGLPGSVGFDMDNLQSVVLNSTVQSEQLARQSVLDAYCPIGVLLSSSGQLVDISGACEVLTQWDGSNNLGSAGGHIWREFWRGIDPLPITSPDKWLVPFDPADPVNTPAGLNVVSPLIQAAFADGVKRIQDSPIALNATMGEIQQSGIHNTAIPLFGGEGFEGSFTIASSRPNDLRDGTYDVNYGNSYIQTVTWDEGGAPVAEGFVTYSQSTDPASPYYKDMTEAYSKKQWISFPYTDEAIRSDPGLVQYNLFERANN
ncbi:hypothetical protein FWJ25_03855 [Marinobacter salinexigens]|uniref:Acyl-homoserine-lactone acylase n=1 Tax=Marinobacter salinexigens TaxID=2919747 RepID=A0A5B0VPT4_9GAMM|nr:penicillin acylase family protein [Marinobacter salinexigens]KAA1176278.1 hypothetical protein FWJ25_03855 [Marinobacter salinexigens]